MTRLRHFRTMVFLVLALACGLVRAEVIAINPQIDAEYVVKKGDTLWDIAAYYLQAPWEWPQVWQVNPQIANPHLIYPGDVLVLSFINGKPVIGFRQDSVQKRLSPSVRRTNLDQAVPPIPLDAIGAFLKGPRIIDTSTWKQAPYVLAFEDDRLLGAVGNAVYARNLRDQTDRFWQVLHKGQLIRDPDNGKKLGYECTPVGALELTAFEDPATGKVTGVEREILRGDRLFTQAMKPLPGSFMPAAPKQTIDARIAAVYDGRTTAGRYQIVALNRGSDVGLELGHVLQVHQDGATTFDPTKASFREVKLPTLEIGQLMVFDVSENLSYALVMEASRGVRRGDKATEPRS